jgi:catechol 2,3-dioxygenase-like lactoylglutathione lyase family enzyme
MRLTLIQYAADPKAAAEFYQALGFDLNEAKSDERWIEHDGTGLAVAVHPADEAYRPGTHDLAFQTDAPLSVVAERLTAKGYKPEIVEEPWGTVLWSTDPDGVRVQVSSTATQP